MSDALLTFRAEAAEARAEKAEADKKHLDACCENYFAERQSIVAALGLTDVTDEELLAVVEGLAAGRAVLREDAELNAARAEKAEAALAEARTVRGLQFDCGQDGICALAPGCQRHWSERNGELVERADTAAANHDGV
jgi:hypothetical protein